MASLSLLETLTWTNNKKAKNVEKGPAKSKMKEQSLELKIKITIYLLQLSSITARTQKVRITKKKRFDRIGPLTHQG